MRYAFWIGVLIFAISALTGGFMSGRAAVPHFPSPPTPVPAAITGNTAQTDELADDDFAGDAVVAREAESGDAAADSRLAVVLVGAGHSAPLESPFLSLGIPVTLVVDPSASDAHAIADAARTAGDAVYIQAQVPLSVAQIRFLREAYPYAGGVAARLAGDDAIPAATLSALRDLHFALFDEYGESSTAAASVLRAGVDYSARSLTVDNHTQEGYVRYMLAESVHLGRGTTAVVMARPFPGTLHAFEDLVARAARDGVYFVGMP